MTSINIEPLNYKWSDQPIKDKTYFEKALDYCVLKTRENLVTYKETFLDSSGVNNIYPKRGNEPWTTGFCTGMIWLAFAYTGESCFRDVGRIHTDFFKERMTKNVNLQHHDIGFLYSLSSVADYKLTGNTMARALSIEAADHLCTMYREIPGIIQRGGDMSDLEDPFTGVFIIDCLMNVPLLYWATKDMPHSNAILHSGTYAYNNGRGVMEPCIWGDYFYMEALLRVTKIFDRFW